MNSKERIARELLKELIDSKDYKRMYGYLAILKTTIKQEQKEERVAKIYLSELVLIKKILEEELLKSKGGKRHE